MLVQRATRENEKNPQGPVYALYTERWKFVHRPEQSDLMFDLEADPHKDKTVFGDHPQKGNELLKQLLAELDKR